MVDIRTPADREWSIPVMVELNERGEVPDDPGELEAGAKRCAVV